MTSETPDLQVDDPRTLKALAHPLRLQMLEVLREDGPATATALGERLGESSGSTSYHLRQLAKHGFVEEDTERGGRRERWWRIVDQRIHIQGFDLLARPETRAAATTLLGELVRSREARLRRWYAEGPSWDRSWQQATLDSQARLRLDRDELEAFGKDLMAVVERYTALEDERPAPADGALIEVQLYAFPMRPLGEEETASTDDEEAPGDR
jgi:DNA-binding transcriptional ArsR family regulator